MLCDDKRWIDRKKEKDSDRRVAPLMLPSCLVLQTQQSHT